MNIPHPRRPQRVALLLIVILGGLWALGLLTQPAQGVPGTALNKNDVRFDARQTNGGFSVKGQILDHDLPYVFVSLLRRVYVSGAPRTAVLTSRKSNLVEGAFSEEFDTPGTTEWLNVVAKDWQVNAADLSTDAVLEIAVSGYQLKAPVNRELLAASTFLGYQK